MQEYVTKAFQSGEYRFRYVGSMVADIHRIIKHGGVFLYPYDNRHQKAKLRLLYEANPMAMIVESLGGLANDEVQPILSIQPQSIHQRTSVVIGSQSEVNKISA